MLKEDGQRALDTTSAPNDEEAPERRLRCAGCGAEIAAQSALFGMRSSSAEHVFPNPLGQMRVILTLRAARVVCVSRPTTEFTWFAGYSWRIAVCGACELHLGWLFEAVSTGEPASFYGLLKESLVEG